MIRPATPDDLPALLEMGQAFNTEAGYSETAPFDPASFERTASVLGNAGRLMVADNGSGAIGMAAFDMGVAICNYEVRPAREAFWYVQPDHRRGLGRQMLSALELQAKASGAHFLDVVAESGKRSEALARIYRAAGYIPTEIVFRKWI